VGMKLDGGSLATVAWVFSSTERHGSGLEVEEDEEEKGGTDRLMVGGWMGGWMGRRGGRGEAKVENDFFCAPSRRVVSGL